MADDLTESTVRQHLRDQSGEVSCARCLALELNLELSATESAVVALSERRPPFAAGVFCLRDPPRPALSAAAGRFGRAPPPLPLPSSHPHANKPGPPHRSHH